MKKSNVFILGAVLLLCLGVVAKPSASALDSSPRSEVSYEEEYNIFFEKTSSNGVSDFERGLVAERMIGIVNYNDVEQIVVSPNGTEIKKEINNNGKLVLTLTPETGADTIKNLIN